jgi:hypothetical protein
MKCLMNPALTPASRRFLKLRLAARASVLLVASAVPLMAAHAAGPVRVSDFPTTARVEYVLECMKKHDGKYEYMYKCSCAVDEIGKQVSFDDYVEISTALRHQSLGGERGAEFRDPQVVKQMAGRYKKIEEEAADACFIK